MLCSIKFTYSESGLSEATKRFMEACFLEARNDAIKLLNSRYEEWNDEYGDDMTDYAGYLRFIQNKQNQVLDIFNSGQKACPVKLRSDVDSDIYGEFKLHGQTITMHAGLMPVL